MKKMIDSLEKSVLQAGPLTSLLQDFLLYQQEHDSLENTIEVLLSLFAFTRTQKGDEGSRVQDSVRGALKQWITYRTISEKEKVRVEDIAIIEANEKVIPELSREYWYRRVRGGALLAELGRVKDGTGTGRFLGGIFYQVTAGSPRNFGELTNNRRFDHDPSDGDTVNFYSVSTEESYRDFKFHMGAQLVHEAAKYIGKNYPNVTRFQTFSPFSLEDYALIYLSGEKPTMAPRSFITDEITLEEKDRLLENFFAIRNTLRQQRLKKQGGMTSWTLGFVKGKVDYIYIKMSRLKGREKLFSEILAHVIDAYSNRKLPVEERQMWLGNTVIRRMIRRLYRFLAPWYLQERDSKGRFINPVQNFHMKNGAIPGDILLFGATEMDRRPIWGYTAGGLCCIRYVYPNNEAERLANANKYLEDVKEFVQRGREK